MESIVKISKWMLSAGLLFAVVAAAQPHPDALFLQADAEWSHDMARRHREATQRVGAELDAYADWVEQSGERALTSLWWSRLAAVYDRELDQLQGDINATRKRFRLRNPECIRALDGFEQGLYAQVRADYAQYVSEKPLWEWFGPEVIGVFAGFPNPTCMIRHDNVRKMNEALRQAQSGR